MGSFVRVKKKEKKKGDIKTRLCCVAKSPLGGFKMRQGCGHVSVGGKREKAAEQDQQ